jgi:hypothetical protein
MIMRLCFCRGSAVLSITVLLMTLAPAAAAAEEAQVPWPGCQPVSKAEYDAASKARFYHRYGFQYIATGSFWRRSGYWFCPPIDRPMH